MKRLILALALMLPLAACNPPTKPTLPSDQATTETVVTCVNKHDKKENFSYYPSRTVQWYSDVYNVNVYKFTTTSGKEHSVNSLELENFVCQTAK